MLKMLLGLCHLVTSNATLKTANIENTAGTNGGAITLYRAGDIIIHLTRIRF